MFRLQCVNRAEASRPNALTTTTHPCAEGSLERSCSSLRVTVAFDFCLRRESEIKTRLEGCLKGPP